VKDTYMASRKIKLGNGNVCRLWKDSINEEIPLCDSLPDLFDLCWEQKITIKDAFDNFLIISFRRVLRGESMNNWTHIQEILRSLVLSENPDSIYWSLNENKIFSTRSVYKWLERNLAGYHNKWIWKAKVPLKIKVFLWQLCQVVVLTRENMKKRNWSGSPRSSFCNLLESNHHLFFTCKVALVVWGILGKTLGTNCVPQYFWQAVT
jgi:hypothetical protein